mmetsp:Transcript_17219/g.34420  ORF Transcript_17219/g.34420 Transcript_17219/m.34420 type:complete len:167 (+) Transcript_17219:136-636(+)
MVLSNSFLQCAFIGIAFILFSSSISVEAAEVWGVHEQVQGYRNLGRGSCQDSRGKMYSYLQRTMTFPDAITCAQKECERFGNIGAYRGFEFSVGKRCTCLFDVDQAPPVPDSGEAPDYVGGSDGGDGDVFSTTSMPGTTCFASPGSRIEVKAAFALLSSATIFMLL